MKLTVIGQTMTRTSRVLWLLEELGLDYDHIAAAPRSEEVLALNPAGKVPVLVVDGEAITDSTAILTFLADLTQAFTAPAGTLARARQDGVTQFILDEIDAVLWTAARHTFVLPEARRVPDVRESLKWEFDEAQKRLRVLLGDGPYLMGDEMTVPDIIAVSCLGWAVSAKFPPLDPVLGAYMIRLRARPAFERAMAR